MDIIFFDLEKVLENIDLDSIEKRLAEKHHMYKLKLENGETVYAWSPDKDK